MSTSRDLFDWDDDSYEEHFAAVGQLFGSFDTPEEIIAQARGWWATEDAKVQALGFDLLAVQALEFSWHVEPLVEAADALDLATAEEEVRWSAAHALGTICDDERVLSPLLRFAGDPVAEIRWQVACGIPAVVDPLPDPAVRTMLALMRDPEPGVRDWATMTLGAREHNDTEEIRDAFFGLLEDDGDDVAGEAAVALAARRDARVLPVLEQALADPLVGNLYVEAAACLGDSRLLPLLHALKAGGWQDDEPAPEILDEAIEACA
ncbi:MAG: HEAT repeat domain-containing protein [Streptosporangiaceae bacterium]